MKKTITVIFSAVLLAMMLTSCREQDEFYKELYQAANEYRYPQSLVAFRAEAGYCRAELSWIKTVDPSLDKARIFWNNGKDSLDVDLNNPAIIDGDRAKVIISNIKEGPQVFTAYTFNNDGVRSIASETSVTVRGDDYVATLSERTVKSFARIGDTVQILWNTRTRNLSYCEVKYPSASGIKIIKVDPLETTTVITDYYFASSSAFQYRSVYVVKDLIDTLFKPWIIGGIIK